MYYVFNKTSIGYRHKNEKKICQDFSSSYQDNERAIITCCDGHGGAQYVRSHLGSKAASEAVQNVFKSVDKSFLLRKNSQEIAEKIKLLVLCEYNKLVEKHLTKNRIKENELIGLTEEEIDTLKFNPSKAYGTTLSGVMFYKKKVFIICIGDTEVIAFKKGKFIQIFDNENDPVGNVTNSMCQEDAFKYIKLLVLPANTVDGVILCTDGLSSPFQTYQNFHNSFIKPNIRKILISQSYSYLKDEVDRIAKELGIGDDVSVSLILNEKTKIKDY